MGMRSTLVLLVLLGCALGAWSRGVWQTPAPRTNSDNLRGDSPCGSGAAALAVKPKAAATYYTAGNSPSTYPFSYRIAVSQPAASINMTLVKYLRVGNATIVDTYTFPKNRSLPTSVGTHQISVAFPDFFTPCQTCAVAWELYVPGTPSPTSYLSCVDVGVFSRRHDVRVTLVVRPPPNTAPILPASFVARLDTQFKAEGFRKADQSLPATFEVPAAEFPVGDDGTYRIDITLIDNIEALAAEMARTLQTADLKARLDLDVEDVIVNGESGGSSSNTAAIVAPIVVVLFVLGAVGTFCVVRKKKATGEWCWKK